MSIKTRVARIKVALLSQERRRALALFRSRNDRALASFCDPYACDIDFSTAADDPLDACARKSGVYETADQLDAKSVSQHQGLSDAILAAGEQLERAALVCAQARLS
jgi:hypothetical protein